VKQRYQFLLFFLLTMLSGNVMAAKWVRVATGGNNVYVAYVEVDTIRRVGSMVRMWGMDDFNSPRVNMGYRYKSSKGLAEYDCLNQQSRIINWALFSGNMGTGEVAGYGNTPDNWSPVQPDSVEDILWKIACAKK
jgi:hypothetical protein